jgi:hypothetical protein
MAELSNQLHADAVDRGEWFFRTRHTYGNVLTCRHCGSKDLYWQREKGLWRMYDRSTISIHRCPTPNNRTAEGFKDVD